MSIVRQMRGGKENDPNFGTRMSGTGNSPSSWRSASTSRAASTVSTAVKRPISTAAAFARLPGRCFGACSDEKGLPRRRLGVGCGDRVAVAYHRCRRSKSRTATRPATFSPTRSHVLVRAALRPARILCRRVHRHGDRARIRARRVGCASMSSTWRPTLGVLAGWAAPHLSCRVWLLRDASAAFRAGRTRQLRLSPGVLLVVFQSMVSVGDTYFVGRLGTEPLAGLALVFPLIMLLQMTSAMHGRRRVVCHRARSARRTRASLAGWWCTRW